MNRRERKMRDLVSKGREKYGLCGVKAEFEAEGTRIDELLRLLDIASSANVDVAVKIGGCEAKRDLLEAKQIGVQYVIAPMVETDYALSKYAQSVGSLIAADEREDTDFLFNMETITGYNNRDEILRFASSSPHIDGVVFGRSDFTGSLGQEGDLVNSSEVTDYVLDISKRCSENGLDLVVGGGVSLDAIPALSAIREIHLTRFETRKMVFFADALDEPSLQDGLLNAVKFELLWLSNKREYYGAIFREDDKRFSALETRWNVSDWDI